MSEVVPLQRSKNPKIYGLKDATTTHVACVITIDNELSSLGINHKPLHVTKTKWTEIFLLLNLLNFFSFFLSLFPPSFVLGLFAHFALCKIVQSSQDGHQDQEIMWATFATSLQAQAHQVLPIHISKDAEPTFTIWTAAMYLGCHCQEKNCSK